MRLNPSHKVLTLLIFSLFTFCAASFAQNTPPFQGEVNADNINIRSDSTPGAQVICTVNRRERLDVLLELYDWYKIRLPKNAPSYIKKSLTQCFNFADGSKVCLNAKILKNRVNVRLKPGESSPILGKVEKDEIVNVLDDRGEWIRIEPVANSFGWIHKKFVNKAPLQEKPFKAASEPSTETTSQAKEEKDNNNITLVGIVKPYGKIFKRVATHKLFTADNKVYLLKWNKQTLG